MRTPNTECCICKKPLYRRPFELAKVRYVACMNHREDAKRTFPLTDKQKEALLLGRVKGTNHLEGIPKSEESNKRRSIAHKKWCAENPDKVAARSQKTQGENHYRWNDGSSKLNLSIRLMTENRKWMDMVKERDGRCQECGSVENLESHHIVPLLQLIEEHGIKNREDARRYKDKLWDIDNGVALCDRCHCVKHGRKYTPPLNGRRYCHTSPRDG